MKRFLGTLVILEAVAIVVLAILLIRSRGLTGQSATSRQATSPLPEPRAIVNRAHTPATDSPEPTAPSEQHSSSEPSDSPATPVEAPEPTLDPVGIVVYGKVTEPGGNPVDGASVFLTDASGGYRASRAEKGAGYAITGLQPGAFKLEGLSEGYVAERKEVVLKSSETVRRIDLVLKPAVILKVRFVTPDGRRLAEVMREEGKDLHWRIGVIAVATREHPGKLLPLTDLRSHSTFGVGEFRAPDESRLYGRASEIAESVDGVLQLSEPPPVYVSAALRHVVLATERGPAGADSVLLTVSMAALRAQLSGVRLQVLDGATLAPVTKAFVDVHDRQTSGPAGPIGENGVFSLDVQPPGLLVLTIHAEGYEIFGQTICLEPGVVTDLGVIRLDRAASLRGVVVDAAQKPAQVKLTYYPLDRAGDVEPLRDARTTETDSSGAFTLDRLGRRRYVFLVDSPDWALKPVVADVSSGRVEDFRIVIEQGAEVVLEPQVGSEGRLGFTLSDGSGTRIAARYFFKDWPVRLRLFPGDYELGLRDDSGPRWTRPFTVGTRPLRIPVTP